MSTATVDLRPSHCTCGCGLPVTRRFRQGHDTRLRAALRAAHRDGRQVRVRLGDSEVTVPAAQAVEYAGADTAWVTQ